MREKDIAIVLSVRDIKKEGTIACTTMMMEFLDINRGKKNRELKKLKESAREGQN